MVRPAGIEPATYGFEVTAERFRFTGNRNKSGHYTGRRMKIKANNPQPCNLGATRNRTLKTRLHPRGMSHEHSSRPALSSLFRLSGGLRAPGRRGSPEKVGDLLPAPFTVLRLMTPLKMSYEAAKETSGAVYQDPGGTPRDAPGHHKTREAGG